MTVRGKILKINHELGYGFVSCPKYGQVFFTAETQFSGASFGGLKINEPVQVEVVETERGLFAQALTGNPPPRPTPENTAIF